MPEVEIAVDAGAHHGQAPTWDSRTGTLLWTDLPANVVHRFSPASGSDHTMCTPQPVGAAKPRFPGGLLLHLDDGIALFESDGHTRTWLVYWHQDGFRAGGTAIDAHGHVWAATVPTWENDQPAKPPGAETHSWLVRATPQGRATTALRGVSWARGMCFAPAGTTLYVVDRAGAVEALSVDLDSGQVTGRRTVCEVTGLPDGICADATGCLWVVTQNPGRVDRYTPDGVLDRSVPLPVNHPTDCCFGGNRLTDLYITTAATGPASNDSQRNSSADGALLVLDGAGSGLRTPAFAG